jgi:uncharacterized protein (DUF488 family)
MKIYTIGFTKKSAEVFFTRIKNVGVARLIDIRLNNTSQLAGFSKIDDLRYFTRELCQIDYVHVPELAPTANILDAWKKQKDNWEQFERGFLELLQERRVAETIQRELFADACLLCSEEKPHHCHRRLVAEYLREKWGGIRIEHIP